MGRTPMQVMYCLERVPAVVRARPELANVEPLSGNREAIAKLPMKELEEILFATLSGMTADEFTAEVKMDRDSQTSALEPSFHRTNLSTHVGGPELFAFERLQDLHCDRWWAGLRACVL